MPSIVRALWRTHFIKSAAPTTGVQVGTLWTDTTNNLLKRCTSISPITFVSTEGGGFYQTVESGGTPLTQRATMNFTGAGVSVTDSGGKTVVDIAGGGAGSDAKTAVYKDGVQVGAVARKLDFRGADLTVAEDAANDQFDITLQHRFTRSFLFMGA